MRFPTAITALCAGLLLLAGCPDKKPKYPNCKKDEDCQEGEVCVNQRCMQCAEDTDCAEGEECIDGACIQKEGFCNTDDDCTDGKVCKDNKCVPCESDGDCGPTARCSNGRCLERGKCVEDTDCADDEDCIDGVCQKPSASSTPDTDCTLATVYFDFDSFAIADDARDKLSSTAECIQENPDENVRILGHTDPRGTEEYNIALSEKRAQAAADYLARLGIDPARFRVIPKGETEATGVDEGSWQQDRKAEFEWE